MKEWKQSDKTRNEKNRYGGIKMEEQKNKNEN